MRGQPSRSWLPCSHRAWLRGKPAILTEKGKPGAFRAFFHLKNHLYSKSNE